MAEGRRVDLKGRRLRNGETQRKDKNQERYGMYTYKYVDNSGKIKYACYIMKVKKAANYQVTQESMYQAQEQVINDLKEENAELIKWKYHTIDYDELEERVSVLEKTVATLKKVAVKLFRFVKNQ